MNTLVENQIRWQELFEWNFSNIGASPKSQQRDDMKLKSFCTAEETISKENGLKKWETTFIPKIEN